MTGADRGVVAPDGSPVEVYRALPRPAELDAIHDAIPAGSTILDLGAGVGRFARPLAGLGHHVIAVDHEPAMLAELGSVDGVEPVVADIAECAAAVYKENGRYRRRPGPE